MEIIPPYSQEVEQAILGAIFLEPDVLVDVDVEPQHFYKGSHQKLFAMISELSEKGLPVDLVHVGEALKAAGSLDVVGGNSYLAQIASSAVTSVNIDSHVKLLKDFFAKRLILSTCMDVQNRVHNGADVEELIAKMAINVETGGKRGTQGIKDIVLKLVSATETRSISKEVVGGVSSGLRRLDDVTDGFHGGDLIIIAGRPGMGKTALAGQIATGCGVPCHIESIEMMAADLARRMVASAGNVSGSKIRKANLSRDEWGRFMSAAGSVKELPITINDVSFNIHDIHRDILQAYKNGSRLVILDYIQIARNKDAKSREREVGEVASMLKTTAKQLNIPIIALAQLNRGVETRENKRPNLADLRDSGQIEQDADIVLFIHREGYYKKVKDPNAVDNTAQIILAKGRNVMTDTINVGWDGAQTKFEEVEF